MPRYEFLCEKCKGAKIVPQLGGFMAQTARRCDRREAHGRPT